MPFLQSKTGSSPVSPRRITFGFSAKLPQPFWKSKSKNSSIGSESQGSVSTISGLGSPPFTPDSSLSIYTNSLDSDCSNSSATSNSNQISPIEIVGFSSSSSTKNKSNSLTCSSTSSISTTKNNHDDMIMKKPKSSLNLEDHISTFSYSNDCERYAANMYYDMGDSTSFECRVPIDINSSGTMDRFRNNNNNINNSSLLPFEEEDGSVHRYYNNSTFSTFPNPRRHSFAYSSCSSSLTSNNSNGSGSGRSRSKYHQQQQQQQQQDQEEMIELLPISQLQGPDGYLIPISGSSNNSNGGSSSSSSSLRMTFSKIKPINNNKKNLYVNDTSITNTASSSTTCSSTPPSTTTAITNKVVQVDVHTPAVSSSSLLSSGGGTGLAIGKMHCNIKEEDSQSSSTPLLSIESTSTRGSRQESNDSDSTTTITDQATQITKDKVLPTYISRILQAASSDCEPFCSLCATSANILTKTTKMDVAIISCKECFFSDRAEKHIRGFFDRMVTPENQKIDIVLQGYDLKDLDHHICAAEVHRAKVQIVIISNHFLDRLRHEATSRKKLAPINRVLRSKRVIAVLASCNTATEIAEGYQNVLARFNEWFTVELKSTTKLDVEFCRKFTDQVVKIYNVELNTSSNFSVFPKKVTREQPKIVIMLKKPVDSTDMIRVELTRDRETVAVNSVSITNPHTIIIRIPETLCQDRTALVEIAVSVNQQKLGTKLVKYENHLKNIEDDIINKMATALPGFLKLLDDHVSRTLSKHFSNNSDWTVDPDLELLHDVLISKGDDFPTPLHFSAYYGLEQTVWTLLDEADGLEMCVSRNDMNETPIDVAKEGKISQMMKDYMTVTAIRYVEDLIHHGDSFGDEEERGSTIDGETVPQVHNETRTNEREPETKCTEHTNMNSNNIKNCHQDQDSESNNTQGRQKPVEDSDDKKVIVDGEISDLKLNQEDSDSDISITNEEINSNGIQSGTITNATLPSYQNFSVLGHVNTTEQDDKIDATNQISRRIPALRNKPNVTIPTNRDRKGWSINNFPNGNERKGSPAIDHPYETADSRNPFDFSPELKPKPKSTSNSNDTNAKVGNNNSHTFSSSPTTLTALSLYDVPKSTKPVISEKYDVPPSWTKPVTPPSSSRRKRTPPITPSPMNHVTQPVFSPKNGCATTKDGYVVVHSIQNSDPLYQNVTAPAPLSGENPSTEDREPKAIDESPTIVPSTTQVPNIDVPSFPRGGILLDPTDEALINLLNDFKNKKCGVRELELLFVNWKDRPDVKNSYQEKGKRLEEMRKEYRSIQEQMNKSSRRPSVLDKVFKPFFNRKKTSVQNENTIVEEDTDSLENKFSDPSDIRKLSGNLDRESLESVTTRSSGAIDSGSSDTEVNTECHPRKPVDWINPLDTKFQAGDYIYPTIPSTSCSSSNDSAIEDEGSKIGHSPPPRPAKPKPQTNNNIITNGVKSSAVPALPSRNANNNNLPFKLVEYETRNGQQPSPRRRPPYVNY